MVARGADGETRAFPLVETVHRDSICWVTEAPAHVPAQVNEAAAQLAEAAVNALAGSELLSRFDTLFFSACFVSAAASTGDRRVPRAQGRHHRQSWHQSCCIKCPLLACCSQSAGFSRPVNNTG